MKAAKIVLIFILISLTTFAQTPEAFKYQAVVRNASGIVQANKQIGIRMDILQGSASGLSVYVESFAPTTDQYGLIHLEIGNGTVSSGSFNTIDWSAGTYFIEMAIDLSGGTNYTVMGTTQLLSVPYALHAQTAESITGPINEVDGSITNEIQSLSINENTITLSNGGGSVEVPSNKLTEAEVDAFTNNNGYLNTEIDGSVTNEIQTLSISGNDLTISGASGNTVSIPSTSSAWEESGDVTYISDHQIGIRTSSPNAFAVLHIKDGELADGGVDNDMDGVVDETGEEFVFTHTGRLGIGTTSPAERLSVTGTIQSTTGGFKFPDGTTQTTAAVGGGASSVDGLADGKSDSDGSENGSSIFLGSGAGAVDDQSDNENVGIGFESMNSNTSGYQNTAVGYQSLINSTVGTRNTAIGNKALQTNTSGFNNTAIGFFTMYNNLTGYYNTAIGSEALNNNTAGRNNTAVGYLAAYSNTLGEDNTATGIQALRSNSTGSYNTAAGRNSLYYSTGNYNTSTGYSSLFGLSSGAQNSALGSNAGGYIADGSTENSASDNSIFIGANSKAKASGETNQIVIGYDAIGNGSHTATYGNGNITSHTFTSGNIVVNGLIDGRDIAADGAALDAISGSPWDVNGDIIYRTDGQIGIRTSTPSANAILHIKDGELIEGAIDNDIDGVIDEVGEEFVFTNTGRLGIGTTSPDERLSVTGTIQSTTGGFKFPDGTVQLTAAGSGGSSINDLSDGKSDNDGSEDGSSVFLGVGAGSNDDGTDNKNVGVGFNALTNNTEGFLNTAYGHSSLLANTTGNSNTAIGLWTLLQNTTGSGNTAVGFRALDGNTQGWNNTASGQQVLFQNTTGNFNTGSGYQALYFNTTGHKNTATGYQALYGNTIGEENTASGMGALGANTSGSYNTGVGKYALSDNGTGSDNIALGSNAGRFIAGGSISNSASDNSVFLGSSSKANASGETNQIVIGYDATGNGSNTATYGNNSITSHTFTSGNLVVNGLVDGRDIAADGAALDALGSGGSSGHYVGELFGGGIVFFVYNNGANGLIASLDDLDDGSGAQWSADGADVPNCESMTDGATNTASIISAGGAANEAAGLCAAYSGGGFNDWYLPSHRELALLYSNDVLIDLTLNNDGNNATNGFTQESIAPAYGGYWSSTENASLSNWAYSQFESSETKTNIKKVRAIRAF